MLCHDLTTPSANATTAEMLRLPIDSGESQIAPILEADDAAICDDQVAKGAELLAQHQAGVADRLIQTTSQIRAVQGEAGNSCVVPAPASELQGNVQWKRTPHLPHIWHIAAGIEVTARIDVLLPTPKCQRSHVMLSDKPGAQFMAPQLLRVNISITISTVPGNRVSTHAPERFSGSEPRRSSE